MGTVGIGQTVMLPVRIEMRTRRHEVRGLAPPDRVNVKPVLAGLESVHPEHDAHAAGDFAERCGPDNVRLGVFELSPGGLGVGNRRQPKTKSQHREHNDEMSRRRSMSFPRSARCFSAAIYAASAEMSDGESCAPPIGGITP